MGRGGSRCVAAREATELRLREGTSNVCYKTPEPQQDRDTGLREKDKIPHLKMCIAGGEILWRLTGEGALGDTNEESIACGEITLCQTLCDVLAIWE